MIVFAYYLAKLIICSGIFIFYYLLFLKNRKFHQWNRFYLLSVILLSVVIPLINIPITHVNNDLVNTRIQLLNIVQSTNNYLDEITIGAQKSFSTDLWLILSYIFISLISALIFIRSLIKIKSIIRSHKIHSFSDIKFINTNIPGTPFSFFKYIVWNEEIDLQSNTGQQIFNHELVHVKEKHTLDKLFLQIVLMVFWSNPFFWFIRKELNLIHEFIADGKSIGNQGASTFAAMIIQTAYPSKFNSLTNQYFQSSIKRRFAMINKTYSSKMNFLGRALVLPVMIITFMAFTMKYKLINPYPGKLEKQVVVVIDAGHGFKDGKKTGAMAGNIYEDDITLAIAQSIKKLNTDKNLNLILTRTSAENIDLRKRVDIANENHADLFISIHVNAAPPVNSEGKNIDANLDGMEVVISKNNTSIQEASRKLGSVIVSELSSTYKINQQLQTSNAGVWVLDQSPRPSVLIECGYLTNEKDRKFISGADNQKLIAQKILSAITLYANSVNEKSGLINNGSSNTKGTPISISTKDTIKPDPLIVIDGKIFGRFSKYKNQLDTNAENINSINILKDEQAIKKYGKEGKEGVIEIISKDPSKPVIQKKEIISIHNQTLCLFIDKC